MMQNKKVILVMGVLVLVVGAAAFVGGRMLNSRVNPLGLLGLGGKGDSMSIAINVIPAEELPKTPPEGMGLFVERKDKTIVIQSLSMKGGAGGVVVVAKGEGEAVAGSRVDPESGPRVEIVITNETIIYRETTDLGEPPSMKSGETETIQQTVEKSTLDELNSQSMVTVWGRRNGDRIIADILFYSNPVIFKRPAP
jgi:hypothetical protein